jgi:uncharacterized Zn finger protein (UPF0148 family)
MAKIKAIKKEASHCPLCGQEVEPRVTLHNKEVVCPDHGRLLVEVYERDP